jgi:hypothetical protein
VREMAGAALIWLVLIGMGFLAAGKLLPGSAMRLALVAIAVIALLISWRQPSRIAGAAFAALLVSSVITFDGPRVETVRSFFGVHKLSKTEDGRFLKLVHGNTLHGAIRLLNDDGTPAAGRPEPTTYYTYEGAIGTLISSMRQAQGGTLGSVLVVGLGTGSLACHSAPQEDWTFLEIDPEVIRIAETPRYFRFLSECAPAAEIVLGDARLTMADQPSGKGLIVVDAFSSDAIPAHLMTREAIGLYLSKLDARGSIVLHISNRHLDLSRILARTAAEHGLSTFVLKEVRQESVERRLRAPSYVAVLTRDPTHLGPVATGGSVKFLAPEMPRRPWTDDFSNIVQAIADNNGW